MQFDVRKNFNNEFENVKEFGLSNSNMVIFKGKKVIKEEKIGNFLKKI